MGNPFAGEVSIVLDGVPHVMRLTLGALAELEDGLGGGSVVELAERFESGQVSAGDILALIVAGLRGGGWAGRRADLIAAEIEGGFVEAARLAAQLLVRGFAIPESG